MYTTPLDNNQAAINMIRGTNSRLPPLRNTNQRISTQNRSESDVQSNVPLKSKIRKGYQIAEYTKAVEYLHSQSYARKIVGPDGNPDYQSHQICTDTQQLKHYGLGIYLYLQFIKRLAVTMLVMSTINFVPIIYSYINGKAMKTYTQSYMISLAKTSLGNIQNGDKTTYLVFTVCDLLSMLVLFFFYLHWRSFHSQAVDNEAKDVNIVNPTNYVVSVVGFDGNTPNLQKSLVSYIDQVFPGAYQVEIVCNYNGNFSKFVYYDELIEKRQKQKQVMVQTGKKNEDFLKLENQLKEFEDDLSLISQVFQPEYAIIHFRTLKSRNNFINFCKRYSLVDKFSYNLKRFICCQHLPPQNQLFMKKDALMIKSLKLSRPQQINWQNLDISTISRSLRWIISIILLIICIAITTSLIALCTLYVSSTSACSNYDSTTLLSTAVANGGQTLYCFCSGHFTEIYTVASYQSACNGLSNTILYANIMQVGASLVSSVSNILLIIAVGLIARYVLKPDSKPKQYSFIFVGVLLSNYLNASILPLVMNGDIFGFQSLHYLTFINFIDFNKVAIFKDYSKDWYAIVGPYYMNFLIIAIISPIINLLITCLFGCYNHWSVKKACQKNDKQNPLIQKQANNNIASIIFDLPTEQAIVCLNIIIAIMYSSLLPLVLPITTAYLIVTFICKKTIILRYSVRVPADEGLSQKIITLMPFILLAHFLMGIWSHTAPGLFQVGQYVVKFDWKFLGQKLDRIFLDIPMLAGGALVLAWIIFDYTILSFLSCFSECCLKDEMDVPKQFASLQNVSYQDYIKRANVLSSYKLLHNPTYGHAIKAYEQLKKRRGKQSMRNTMKTKEQSDKNLSPNKFGQQTMQTLDIRRNEEIYHQENFSPQKRY